MHVERHALVVTTAAGGGATVFSSRPVRGEVLQIRYVPDGTSPLATGADVDITGDVSGVVVLNQDNIGTSAFTKAPRQPTHDEAGVASLYAAAGEPVEAPMVLADERIKLVVANGGDTKIGTFHVYVAGAW